MHMMTEIVVEYPTVSDDPCLESIDHFKDPIQERNLKRLDMLVMMVPCTDKSFYRNTDNCINHEELNISNQEI